MGTAIFLKNPHPESADYPDNSVIVLSESRENEFMPRLWNRGERCREYRGGPSKNLIVAE